MNRYLFWILMALPWIAITLHIKFSEDAVFNSWVFAALFLYLASVIEVRRRSVGLSVKEALKTQTLFWGHKERQRLYFAKP